MLLRTSVPLRPPAPARARRGTLRRAAWVMLLTAVTMVLGALGLLSATELNTVAAQSATQNELVSSEPSDGATLPVSPTELVFTFAEPFGEDDVFTAPVSCGNEPVSTGLPDLGDEPNVITVAVPEALPRGACTVSWAVRDGLGEPIASGLVAFSVQTAPPTDPETTETETVPTPAPVAPPTAQPDDGDGSAGGALWLGRVLSTTAILALFGAIVLIGVAWPEGPEYVITVRFLRSLWALALVGTVLFMVAYTAEVTDSAFGASLAPTNWLDLTDAGWPGRAALARFLLVLLLFWVVVRPERIIDPTTQLAAYVLPGLAVVAVGLSRTGGNLAAIGVGLSVAHAFAAAVWVGGALLVARVVVAGPGDDDLVHAVRGFNRVSGPAILVTVGTGVAQMLRIVGGGLFTTGHGRVMLLKTVAVAGMVFVAVAARQLVAARLRRAGELSAPNADRFRRAFTAEAGLGVAVLALSGWLLALTPAGFDERPTYAVERVFTDPASGLDVSVFVGPSQVGLNGIRVEVRSPEEGISNLSVAFLPPVEAEARGIEQPIPLTGAGTAVLDQSDGLPFDVAGQWTMQLTGVTPAGTLTGATTTFPVRGANGDDEATVATTEPSTTVAPTAVSIEIVELEPAGS